MYTGYDDLNYNLFTLYSELELFYFTFSFSFIHYVLLNLNAQVFLVKIKTRITDPNLYSVS